jgi:SAM-dependent methyltransferase
MSGGLVNRVLYKKERLSSVDLNLFDADYIIKKNILDFLPKDEYINVLDYGAGNSPWERYISCENYHKADIDQNKNNDIDTIIEIGKPLPLDEGSFDLILLMDVLAHTPDVDFTLKECKRLLKTDGVIMLTMPFIHRENETPFDYFRTTSFGIKAVLLRNGYKVNVVQKISNAFLTMYSLFVERGIKNGEEFKQGLVGRIFNRILNIFLPILNKTLFLPYPNDDDGIFHHLLVSAQKK